MKHRTLYQVAFDSTIVITATLGFWLTVAYTIGIIS